MTAVRNQAMILPPGPPGKPCLAAKPKRQAWWLGVLVAGAGPEPAPMPVAAAQRSQQSSTWPRWQEGLLVHGELDEP